MLVLIFIMFNKINLNLFIILIYRLGPPMAQDLKLVLENLL